MTPRRQAPSSCRTRAIASSCAVLPGCTPARWPSQSISIKAGMASCASRARRATARAASRLSTTTVRSTPRRRNASTRSSLAGDTPTAYSRSVTPAAANCSASCSVDTAAGPCGEDMSRRATSMDLGVFRCGRSCTPCPVISAFRRWMLRIMRVSSSSRHGVSRSSREEGVALWLMAVSEDRIGMAEVWRGAGSACLIWT